MSSRGTRNVSSAELYLTRYSHNALLPSSAGQWDVFLPRIALILRILFVIIRDIRIIRGDFFISINENRDALLPSSARQWFFFFLPRIPRIARILFVLIRNIRAIRGKKTSHCPADEESNSPV